MRILRLCPLLLVLYLSSTASAQDTASKRDQAKEFFRAGEQMYNAAQYSMAADAFEQAYKLLPIPAIAFSAAQAYRLQYALDQKAARLKRAAELYRLYIEGAPQGGRMQDAVSSLADIQSILSRLDEAQLRAGGAPTGTATRTRMIVSSSVPGAVARLDDAEPQPVPVDWNVKPGEHRVRVSAEGYYSYDEVRSVSDGQFHLVPVQLVARPALVSFAGGVGASVSVDGRPQGVLPMSRPVALQPGERVVTLHKRGHGAWSKTITVSRGESLELKPSLKTTTQRKSSYWVAGASLVSFGLGAGLFVSGGFANSDAKSFESKRLGDSGLTAAELQSYQGAITQRNRRYFAGWSFMGAAGVLATTGGILYLLDMPDIGNESLARPPPGGPASEEEPSFEPMALIPAVGPDATGLALVGRF